MQQFFTIPVLSLALVLTLVACASKNGVMIEDIEKTPAAFEDIQGKAWALDEIITESGVILINRQKLESIGMGDAFTLFIDEERISGKGAPNRYFAPYVPGKDQKLSIGPIAGTLMMSIAEPEDIQEREYYDYLEQINHWELTKGKLELFTETLDGDPVILVFTH
jgi:heat shock protein HslJ